MEIIETTHTDQSVELSKSKCKDLKELINSMPNGLHFKGRFVTQDTKTFFRNFAKLGYFYNGKKINEYSHKNYKHIMYFTILKNQFGNLIYVNPDLTFHKNLNLNELREMKTEKVLQS